MATVVSCPSCGTDASSAAARWCGSCGSPLQDDGARDSAEAPAAVRLDESPAVATDEQNVPGRQRGLAVVAVAAIIIVLLALQAGPSQGGDPTGFSARGDAARSGVVSPQELGVPATVAWRLPLEGDGGWNRQRAALAVEHVVLSGPGGVSLHDRGSGDLVWHRPDLHVGGTVALFDETVVVFDLRESAFALTLPNRAAAEGRILGLDAADGSLLWSTSTAYGAPELTSHPAGLVVLDRTRTATLLDPLTGEVRWALDGLDALEASIRGVFVGADAEVVHLMVTRPAGIDPSGAPSELITEHLVGVEATSGTVRFEVAADRETIAAEPLAVIGDVIAGVDARRLWFWDARDGHALGNIAHGLGNTVVALVGARDTVVLVDDGGTLTGYGVPDGTRRWSETPGATDEPPMVAGDGLYVPTGSPAPARPNRMSVLNLRTGQLRGIFETPPGAVRSPPDPNGDFVVTVNGQVQLHAADTTVRSVFATPVRAWPEPVTRDGAVAAVTAAEVVYVDASTGEPRWRLRTSSDPTDIAPDTVHAPAIAEEALVLSPPHSGRGDPDDGLIGLDPSQSVLLWDRTGDGPPPTGPLTLAGETVFLPVAGEIHGHDTVTGRRAFAARAHHPRGAIASHGEYLFAATAPAALVDDPNVTPSLLAIRRLDRRQAWEEPFESCADPTVSGDLVLAVSPEAVSAFDVHRGGREWSVPLDAPGCLDLAVAHGIAVAATGRGELMGIEVDSGAVAWRASVPAGMAAAPTVAGGTVVTPLLDGTIAGIELETGELAWQFGLGATPASAVTVSDGRYLVITREGELVALLP